MVIRLLINKLYLNKYLDISKYTHIIEKLHPEIAHMECISMDTKVNNNKNKV